MLELKRNGQDKIWKVEERIDLTMAVKMGKGREALAWDNGKGW